MSEKDQRDIEWKIEAIIENVVDSIVIETPGIGAYNLEIDLRDFEELKKILRGIIND